MENKLFSCMHYDIYNAISFAVDAYQQTVFFCVFCMVITVNGDCFLKQH
jgi:flagellar biosynthesis protein FlhB